MVDDDAAAEEGAENTFLRKVGKNETRLQELDTKRHGCSSCRHYCCIISVVYRIWIDRPGVRPIENDIVYDLPDHDDHRDLRNHLGDPVISGFFV